MYSVGEIRRGRELGFKRRRQAFIYHPCADCGKLRWVRLIREKPDTARNFNVAECSTVGYILDDGKDKLTLAMCIADNAVNGVLTIPRACIKNVDILEVPSY